VDRFWNKVDKTPGYGPEGTCWVWTAGTFRRGYGAFRIGSKQKKAHRVALELSGVDVPDNLQVCHTCDNPPCCNPAHLFLGTHQDNVNDCVAKNRQTRLPGELHGACMLSDLQVEEIKARKNAGAVQAHLTKEFGVSTALISMIVKGKRRQTRTPKKQEDTSPCADCRKRVLTLGHWYMLTDETWSLAGMKDGYLCLGCLVARLGRKLDLTDLGLDVPVNRMPWTLGALLPYIEQTPELRDWAVPLIREYTDYVSANGPISNRDWFWRTVKDVK